LIIGYSRVGIGRTVGSAVLTGVPVTSISAIVVCADQELLVLLEPHDAVDAGRSQSLDHEVGAVGRRELNPAFVVGIGVGAMTRTLGKLTTPSASRCSSWPSTAIGL
jgi:hypothetical protein